VQAVYSGAVQRQLERRRVAEVDAVGGQCAAGGRHASRRQHVLRPRVHVVGPTTAVVAAATFNSRHCAT